MMSMPFHATKGLPAYLKKCLFHKETEARHLYQNRSYMFAEVARRDGVLGGLENSRQNHQRPVPQKRVAARHRRGRPRRHRTGHEGIELMSIEERAHRMGAKCLNSWANMGRHSG